MKPESMIGKSIPVHDAALKVTGQLQFVDDMELPRMLHAKVLFSPVAVCQE
jgi:CO/xanthine dehydrogenase Mo-binding subunit